MKSKLTALLCFFTLLQATAQTGYKIELSVPEQKEQIVYFASYWDGKPYVKDSVRLSGKGVGTISADEDLPDGQYLIYMKPDIVLDLLLSGDKKDIKINIPHNLQKCTIEGSNDTRLLWQYAADLQKDKEDLDQLKQLLEDSALSDNKRKELSLKYNRLFDKIISHTYSDIDTHKGTWFATYLQGLQSVQPPHIPPKSREEAIANEVYLKDHYFDNLSLTDPRFWETSFFSLLIDDYFNNIIRHDPDSLANAASRLVAMTQGNELCFNKMLMRLFNNAAHSKVMGMENTWAKLAEDYIFEKDIAWIDSTQRENIQAEYAKIQYNRIGMLAHDLTLDLLDGGQTSIYGVDANYMVLYFYDPTCGHCSIEAPLLHDEFYKKYKSTGVEVMAINVNHDKTIWEDFVERKKLTDWINCADVDYKSQYWMFYDVSGTPMLYLLDKERKIIAKKITEKQLIDIMENIYSGN
ncbi:peroxiredoxin [Dysgonomonas sp. PH5-45]|uniref:thioredoxin-like domain-containing protein n=1 Tax=unclassified Dysgonomonas TaxID=2630389 RepID=UPI002476AD92|nr:MULTISPECIES: thioredoxin-like domain-containing protein [unclassified Dysgonomonas]MDH6355674.1 peroxiredoxin [Dysgonomonas sp. PH5-45]MDH6388571.1 peroxiredoxin [Dysgonomonas sp. PH5-37]